MFDVVDVVESAVAYRSRAAQVVDLRPPSESRPGVLTVQVARNLSAVALIKVGRLRARSDQTHIAAKHVVELRQLIEAQPAQDATEPGNSVVTRLGHYGAGFRFGVPDHRTKFVYDESLALESDSLLP